MITRRERRLIASLSNQPLDRLEDACRSDRHRDKFAHLTRDSLDLLIRKEYPRFLALKTFCRDYTHPRFVAPSHLIGTVWKIHVIDEDDYELVCRSVHNGHLVGHDGDTTPASDDEDVENPGKFRLILYPQPEHRSEENKWTKKALAMTRRLYRLYFNEAPPMEIWGDERINPMELQQQQHHHHHHHTRRPTSPPILERNYPPRPNAPLAAPPPPPIPSANLHASSPNSVRGSKAHPVIKKEVFDENSPLINSRTASNSTSSSSRRKNTSPTRVAANASSTPVRRMTVSTAAEPSTPPRSAFFDGSSPSTSSGSGGRRAPHAVKRSHGSPHTSWSSPTSVSHYGLYRPALRRRRISHEGLLLIVPIVTAAGQPQQAPAKLPGHPPSAVRGSAESYGVDTPFQVYMSVFDTVRQLKEKIWSEKGVPVNRQVIWINDNAVNNEGQKLGDLGVAVGDLDDGLGSNSEGKDVIGLQVIKDVKSEPEEKSVAVVKASSSPVANNESNNTSA